MSYLLRLLLLLATTLLIILCCSTITIATNANNINDDDDSIDMSPPFYGAKPPKKQYKMHRRGWETCNRCGGADRLGAIVDDLDDVRTIDDSGVTEILDAVRAHGIIVIKGQNLTRSEQVEFTSKLGSVIVLPPSFEGKDPEPHHPAIQRVTNFWASGKWKGATAKFGAYWHQDGQFWVAPKHNILSILHAQATPPIGGETGFADLRAARATLSKPLLERAKGTKILASVRDIADFVKGTEEDLSKFPNAEHDILQNHALDKGLILYLGSPHMKVNGLETPEAGKVLLQLLFDHCQSPAFTYYHAWDVGDVVIWDNSQTLHHSMPYNNDGSVKRELYRTQARMELPEMKKNNNEESRDEL